MGRSKSGAAKRGAPKRGAASGAPTEKKRKAAVDPKDQSISMFQMIRLNQPAKPAVAVAG